MLPARQSTARTFTVGPVLDEDGVAVTDCVVGDFKIAKNGGAPAALNGSATLTHRHTGHYSLALTVSDLDTVGTAEVVIDDTTNACPPKDIVVYEEAVYDTLFAAGAVGPMPTYTQPSGFLAATFPSDPADHSDVIAATDALATLVNNVPTVAEFEARTPSAAAIANVELVFNTDFDDVYDDDNKVWNSNVLFSDSAAVKNYHGTLAAVDSAGGTITLPVTDAFGSTVIDNDQYAYHFLDIVDGAGETIRLQLGAAHADARKYNVVAGDLTQVDTTSKYVVAENWLANTTHLGGVQAHLTALQTLVVEYATGTLTATVPAVTGSVNNIGAGGITSDSFANNAITGNATSATAVTKIQSGLATAAAVSTIDDLLDTEVAAIQALVTTINSLVDTEVAAIKAQTDKLTFDGSNNVAADVKKMNSTTVNGTGVSGDKWRGA